MKRKYLFCLVIVTLVFTLIGSMMTVGAAPFTNGSFEEVGADGVPEGWTTHQWVQTAGNTKFETIRDGQGKEGQNYVKITVNGQPDDARYRYAADFDYEHQNGVLYKVTGWVKTEGIPNDDKVGANISLDGNLVTSRDVKGTSDWQEIELYVRNYNQPHLTVTVGIGGYSKATTGVAYFDDIRIEKIQEVPPGEPVADAGAPPQPSKAGSGTEGSGNKTLMYILIVAVVALIVVVFFLSQKGKQKSALNPEDGSVVEEGMKNEVKSAGESQVKQADEPKKEKKQQQAPEADDDDDDDDDDALI